jgi:hypothetical protein
MPALVITGLVPVIHAFAADEKKDVDGRDEPGHDPKPPPTTGVTSAAISPMRAS